MAMNNTTEMSLDTEDIMEHFYDRNYVVVILYIPVFLLALVANSLVIAVVIKYHYMRK